MDGAVLAVLAAYQNNLVTSKLMTSVVKGAQMEKMEASDWSRAGGTSGDVTSGVRNR